MATGARSRHMVDGVRAKKRAELAVPTAVQAMRHQAPTMVRGESVTRRARQAGHCQAPTFAQRRRRPQPLRPSLRACPRQSQQRRKPPRARRAVAARAYHGDDLGGRAATIDLESPGQFAVEVTERGRHPKLR